MAGVTQSRDSHSERLFTAAGAPLMRTCRRPGEAPGVPVPISVPPRRAATAQQPLLAPPKLAPPVTEAFASVPGEPPAAMVDPNVQQASCPTCGAGLLGDVHGGGFVRGDKYQPGTPAYDLVGAWAVRHGWVGVNMTYRYAPEVQWPAGRR